jgi:hypothetical protein
VPWTNEQTQWLSGSSDQTQDWLGHDGYHPMTSSLTFEETLPLTLPLIKCCEHARRPLGYTSAVSVDSYGP